MQTMAPPKNSGIAKLLLQFLTREFGGRDAAARGFIEELDTAEAAHLRGLSRGQLAEFEEFQGEQEAAALGQRGGVPGVEKQRGGEVDVECGGHGSGALVTVCRAWCKPEQSVAWRMVLGETSNAQTPSFQKRTLPGCVRPCCGCERVAAFAA